MQKYTPKIHEGGKYVEMLIEAKKCPICSKVMIHKAKAGIFPMYIAINQDAQMKNAGIVFTSNVSVDDKLICVECEASGKADFKCELCGERRPTNLIQESFGYPPEFLCKVCYETVPAKQWDEKTDELYDQHKYDFE